MTIKLQVFTDSFAESAKIAKIAEELGVEAFEPSYSGRHVTVECLSLDDAMAVKLLLREMGYLVQQVRK